MPAKISPLIDDFAQPGWITGPAQYAPQFDDLPRDLPGLVSAVQGLLVHIFWAERYGLKLSEERQQEVQIRTVKQKVARIIELDPSPLSSPRPLENRLVGNCRDFSVLLCAMLRHQGVPARARCGFGTYFLPGHYEDHWVCEVWRAEENCWVMVDAQLDAFQRERLQIRFDPLDMPPGQFWTGGKAWQACRSGQADPETFGIMDMHGMWFIRGDLIRDCLSLNKVEILPWDHWGLMSLRDEELAPSDWGLLDRIAGLSQDGDESLPELRALVQGDRRLAPPPEWTP